MVLGQRRETVETLAHIGQSARQPDMYIGRRRERADRLSLHRSASRPDHPRNAAITARNIETRASWRIRTRSPDGRTTSIDAVSGPLPGARDDDSAGASSNDDINRTGTKADAPEAFNRPSRARRRQRRYYT